MPAESVWPGRLRRVRRLIDHADAASLALFAMRRALVRAAAVAKHRGELPTRDPCREAGVHARAQRLGRRLGIPADSVRQLVELWVGDACRLQSLPPDLGQGGACPGSDTIAASGASPPSNNFDPLPTVPMHLARTTLLRRLPPPARLAPLLRVVPHAVQSALLGTALQRVLAGKRAGSALDFLSGRRLGIEVSDLGLRWVVTRCESQLRVCDRAEPAEATVRGSATDLLLLAARMEDADTLFFQRRLVLTGDTELGLTARNLLDQLPREEVPLGLRILIHRLAGLARDARAAHRGE